MTPTEIEHFYEVFVYVTKRASCPHGVGTTTYVPREGVRIACPEGKDCWLLKLEFTDDHV